MPHLALLHGGRHGSWCWKFLLPELAGSDSPYRTLALDMPGCGTKRSRDSSTITLAEIVAELNQDIRAAGLHDVVLIGHSIAGALLPMMAAADPSLFSHVIYLTTSLPKEGDSINKTMGTSVHGANANEVGFPLNPLTTPPADLMISMFGADLSAEQVAWVMGEVMQDNTPASVISGAVTREGYEKYAGKKTFIVALRDPILPVPWQKIFAERAGVKKENLVEIDTPHEPFVSHPKLLAEVLRGVIGSGRTSRKKGILASI